MEDEAHSQPPQQFRHENWNLFVLALQSVVLRVGWIFKTESVIMPYVVDAISGSGWMRGWLPILSRIGQSVPPLIYAERLRSHSIKKYPLFLTAVGMAVPFLILSVLWWRLEDRQVAWMGPLFLVIYFIFFSATGVNQLAFGTIQGKLVRPNRRGALLGIGGILGSIFAVIAALTWLQDWISMPNYDGFTWVFLFNGVAFLVAGLVSLCCSEHAEESSGLTSYKMIEPFANAWTVFRTDQAFRRAGIVAMLFISSLLVFPHYQWLGMNVIGTSSNDLIVWVIAQNISVGIYSPLLGAVADRFGNRLAIRIGLFAVSFTPVIAILFASGYFPDAEKWYWMTFVLLGLTPVLMRTILNYTLELVGPDRHPQYLSTMRICFAIPFVFSPLVGALMDWIPYEIPFIGVGLLVLTGALMTFRMSEPRFSDDA
ncbi:Major Facilitator Superfamily protein [Thalassoglobus neptunius]|uniref:Major Facilitator Superfamily protein n=1 Tax=Thalassoglobus neptunius TaxID=1938619 RepID=A0A5C5WCX4_9PLAN|nr:MFS transporter [Thalassoglobus neptunius]TWT47973.1 Major Facilitator Superfamily protein [Thalassoglobus neptunius]